MTFQSRKIYLKSTDTVTEESSRKCVTNRMMLWHFVFITLPLSSHEILIELALRLSYIIGAEKVFFQTMKYLSDHLYLKISTISMI